jgi:peptidoglycan/LPS O-acetylase OafA/YrhL
MYVIVAVAWLFLAALKNNRMKVFKIAIITSYCACLALVAAHHFYFPTPLARFFLMFFSGASFFILRNHINLSNSVVLLGAVGLVAAALINAHLLLVLYIFTIAYVLFYLAYIPAGFIRNYNNFGDYSYGIYIYAFPVQQSIAALMPGVSVWIMLFVSGVITLLLAILSWHLIERRALSLKGHCVGRTYRLFAYR